MKEMIESLTIQYEQFCSSLERTGFLPSSMEFQTKHGYIYVRNLARGVIAGKYVFCIANVDFHIEHRGKGILSAFIDYVKKQPNNFFELEFELVHNPRLLSKLVLDGFSPTQPIEGHLAEYIIEERKRTVSIQLQDEADIKVYANYLHRKIYYDETRIGKFNRRSYC